LRAQPIKLFLTGSWIQILERFHLAQMSEGAVFRFAFILRQRLKSTRKKALNHPAVVSEIVILSEAKERRCNILPMLNNLNQPELNHS
jgi:hypothetical protein